MALSQAEIDGFLESPSETRDVELKSWIDPRTPEGKAKLLQSIFAMRNFNGGRILVGFDDKTMAPFTHFLAPIQGDPRRVLRLASCDPGDHLEHRKTKKEAFRPVGGLRAPWRLCQLARSGSARARGLRSVFVPLSEVRRTLS